MDHRNASPPPGLLPERRLFERAQGGDAAARETLLHRYLPLARNVARRYAGRGEAEDDLVQVATLALLRAIDRFDVERRTAFSSFVVPTMAGELKHYFGDRSWTIRPPRDTYELSQRVAKSVEGLARDLGRYPTTAEVAAEAGASVEEVLDARAATDQCGEPRSTQRATKTAPRSSTRWGPRTTASGRPRIEPTSRRS